MKLNIKLLVFKNIIYNINVIWVQINNQIRHTDYEKIPVLDKLCHN